MEKMSDEEKWKILYKYGNIIINILFCIIDVRIINKLILE